MNKKRLILIVILVVTVPILLIGRDEISKLNNRKRSLEQNVIEHSNEKIISDICTNSASNERQVQVLDEINAIDFSVKQPCMEILQEEDILYRQAYLEILQNEIPIINEMGEIVYYKDLWKAGIEVDKLWEFRTEEEYPYAMYYNDLDGDGQPELAISQGCFYILKYELEEKECRILYSEQSCYIKGIIGVGKIWYHDGLHGNVLRDRYISFDEEGEWKIIFDIEQGLDPQFSYYLVGTSEYSSEQIEVDEKAWNKITKPFFEATEKKLLPQSFEEILGELYKG